MLRKSKAVAGNAIQYIRYLYLLYIFSLPLNLEIVSDKSSSPDMKIYSLKLKLLRMSGFILIYLVVFENKFLNWFAKLHSSGTTIIVNGRFDCNGLWIEMAVKLLNITFNRSLDVKYATFPLIFGNCCLLHLCIHSLLLENRTCSVYLLSIQSKISDHWITHHYIVVVEIYVRCFFNFFFLSFIEWIMVIDFVVVGM